MDEEQQKINDLYKSALNCDSQEFSEKYKAYKQAEKEFNDLYEPFKENLIKLYEDNTNCDLPKVVLIGDIKLTYVAPTTRTSVDTKKLKEEEPDIVKKYTKTTNVKASIRLEDVFGIDLNNK